MAKFDIGPVDECWIWKAARIPDGYGSFYKGPERVLAHRMSYELFKGEIPEGMRVLHKCDNPPCVNPNHLFLGSQADNILDMIIKERTSWFRKGELANRAKLTYQQAEEIRALYFNKTYNKPELAKRFGVSYQSIARVINKETYIVHS